MKKGVIRNFAKFTGKHLCQSLFFNKVAGPFLQNTSKRLLVVVAVMKTSYRKLDPKIINYIFRFF